MEIGVTLHNLLVDVLWIKIEWSVSIAFVVFGKHQLFEDLVEVEIDSFLRYPSHHVRSYSLIQPLDSLLSDSFWGYFDRAPVFLNRTVDILILLDAGPDSCDGIADKNREYFAEAPADEIFLVESRLRQFQFFVD